MVSAAIGAESSGLTDPDPAVFFSFHLDDLVGLLPALAVFELATPTPASSERTAATLTFENVVFTL
jgi:hypothetical protein